MALLQASPQSSMEKENNLELFGLKLRQLRERAGQTQQRLAETAACSVESITKMERGARLPSPELLGCLLQALKGPQVAPGELQELEDLRLACKMAGRKAKKVDELFNSLTMPDPAGEGSFSLDIKNNPSVVGWGQAKGYSRLFGREASLAELLEVFKRPGQNQPVIIAGLGGVGKSALAHEVAERALGEAIFDQLIWESAQSEVLVGDRVESVPVPSAWLAISPSLTFEGLLDSLACHLERPDLLAAGTRIEVKLREITQEFKKKPYLMVLDSLEAGQNPRLILTYLGRLFQQTSSRLLVTSREIPDYIEGYSLNLGALANEAALDFLRHKGKEQNIGGLREENPEVETALQQIIEATGGHPLAMQFVTRQLGLFSLSDILESLRTKANGGLYAYIYKRAWAGLSQASRELLGQLLAKPTWDGPALTNLFSRLPTGPSSTHLHELARSCLVEVQGSLQKSYSLHPLTRNFLQG